MAKSINYSSAHTLFFIVFPCSLISTIHPDIFNRYTGSSFSETLIVTSSSPKCDIVIRQKFYILHFFVQNIKTLSNLAKTKNVEFLLNQESFFGLIDEHESTSNKLKKMVMLRIFLCNFVKFRYLTKTCDLHTFLQ